MQLGTEQFQGLSELNNYEYENRMMVFTDAQPNTGDVSVSGFSVSPDRMPTEEFIQRLLVLGWISTLSSLTR